MDFGNGRLTLNRSNIFVFLSSIIFIYACEIEESKNIYKPPLIFASFEKDNSENIYTFEDLNIISDELSELFNIDIDIFSSNIVRFEGQIISNYIDCGLMNNEIYVSYIDRIFDSYLDVTINFKILEEDNIFKIINDDIKYTFYSKETGTRWRFKTNKPKELLVGNPAFDENPYRTCLSKNILEKEITGIFDLNQTIAKNEKN